LQVPCRRRRLDTEAVRTDDGHGPTATPAEYTHMLRELAQHCGHADILREQVLAARDES
jgi:Protein of unknown function (DUF664)